MCSAVMGAVLMHLRLIIAFVCALHHVYIERVRRCLLASSQPQRRGSASYPVYVAHPGLTLSFSIETELVVPEIAQTGPIRSLSRGQMLTASVARVVVSGNASA